MPDGTHTVETSDSTNVIIKTKGFRNEIAARNWIAEQKRAQAAGVI